MKDGVFCLQCLAQSGLLTSPHVHTGCLWFVWASEKMWDTFEFQTFREFCSRCFTSGIVWTPPPQLSASQDIFRLNVPSPVKMCLRCACEGSHMCVHSGMRFLFFARHLRLFLWGIFPECFSYSYEEPNVSCFLDYVKKPWLVVKYASLIIESGFGCLI